MRRLLLRHDVVTAYERGWSTLKNGELLREAEAAGFAVLVTTDTHLRHQQNLAARRVGGVVLTTTSWPRIRLAAEKIALAIDGVAPGSCSEVVIA